MKSFKVAKLTKACHIALLGTSSMLMLSNAAFAAEEINANDAASEEVEVIEVTGFRASEQQSRDIKKEAVGVVDAIIAEDIGKMPDDNVAEALQRVTGISITRANGEGSQVSVRGMAPNLNRIVVNGKTLTSAGDDQAVGLEAFSSGLLERVEVFKTPGASMVEGSLGATISLKTRRALDAKKRKIVVSANAGYSDLSEEVDPKLQLNYIDQFFDNKFGFAGNLNYEKRRNRQDGMEVFGYIMPTSVTGGKKGAPGTITDPEEGVIRSLPEGHPDRFFNGEDLGPFGAARPNNFNFRQYQQERERIGGSASFEYRPNDSTEFVFDIGASTYDVEQDRYQFSLGPNYINPDTMILNDNNTVVYGDGYLTDENGIPNPDDMGNMVSNNAWSTKEETNYIVGLDASKNFDRLSISGSIGYSYTELETPESFRLSFNTSHAGVRTPYSFDSRLGDMPSILFGEEDAHLEPSRYTIQAVTSSTDMTEDDEISAKFDLDYDLDFHWIQTLEFGVRATKRNKDRISDAPRFTSSAEGVNQYNWNMTLADDGVQGDFPVNDFYDGVSGNTIHSWPIANLDASLAGFGITKEELQNSELSDPNKLNGYNIEEQTQAAYIMANFENDSGSLVGNVGVRFVHTDTTSTGGVKEGDEIVITDFENDYDNVLPSLNLRYSFTDETILRFAAGRVMARPSFGEIAPRLSISSSDATGKIKGGNPYLDPYLSDQVDLSLEYYMGDSGMVSLGLFYKDIEDYILKTTVVSPYYDSSGECYLGGDGSDVDEDGCKLFEITRPINGPSSEVVGAEVNVYRDLDFLPSFWSNFSIKFNYTYNDSTAEIVDPNTGEVVEGTEFPLEGLSEHTTNATLAYETHDFGIRLSHNYRSEYLNSAFGSQNNAQYVDDYQQFDLSGSYKINDSIKVVIKAVNITDEEKTAYFDQLPYWEQIGSTERLKYYNTNGRRYSIGVTASF
ncbi:TonB-dependent receptor [Thalassotalea fonticola]|uniref:TonB-dependent receptor n=1 Tax=Thalassotalea fonticola TaxID=3065649 RepID=A0ABZ0GV31_9GAMM|nr:TonB-dependent receptor [Colwelliaceae bacterium S1-1]